jgi:hypothetical protein
MFRRYSIANKPIVFYPFPAEFSHMGISSRRLKVPAMFLKATPANRPEDCRPARSAKASCEGAGRLVEGCVSSFGAGRDGNAWFLGREPTNGHAFIIHQPNAPSGGRLSRVELRVLAEQRERT